VDPRTGRAFIVGTEPLLTGEVVGAQAGVVSVLDTRHGAVARSVMVGHAPAALAINARTGRAFVANGGDNTVSMLDTRDGTLLHTGALDHGAIPLTMTHAALAVDAARANVRAWGRLDGAGLLTGRGRLVVVDAPTASGCGR
jgi:DNA-binding beta-propeller fold protein YncE